MGRVCCVFGSYDAYPFTTTKRHKDSKCAAFTPPKVLNNVNGSIFLILTCSFGARRGKTEGRREGGGKRAWTSERKSTLRVLKDFGMPS